MAKKDMKIEMLQSVNQNNENSIIQQAKYNKDLDEELNRIKNQPDSAIGTSTTAI